MININKIIRPNILTLQPYSSAREEFTGKEGIFLDANENPFGTLNRYPDPYQKTLKEQLAKMKGVETNNIFIGNGSDEVIDLAFRLFCRPGIDKAITFTPTYGMYDVAAAINEVELVKIPLKEDFQINTGALTNYLQDASIKLLFICSPNNPTGNLMRQEDIKYLLRHFNGVVVIDEAYIDFAQTNSFITLIQTYNNLIVSQTFSKAWGLAAARIGTAYAHKEIIAFYNKIKPPYNVSLNNQQAALRALQNSEKYRTEVALILKEKERLIAALQSINTVKKVYPSDTNFILLKVNDADRLYRRLTDQKIIIRNRNNQIPDCLRITIGTPQENDALLKALKNNL